MPAVLKLQASFMLFNRLRGECRADQKGILLIMFWNVKCLSMPQHAATQSVSNLSQWGRLICFLLVLTGNTVRVTSHRILHPQYYFQNRHFMLIQQKAVAGERLTFFFALCQSWFAIFVLGKLFIKGARRASANISMRFVYNSKVWKS